MDKPTLQSITKRPIVIGTSCLTNPAGTERISNEYIMASAAVRQAEALERIAEALEITNERQRRQQAAATLDSPDGRTVVHASKERYGKQVKVEMDFSSQAHAARFFETYSESMRQAVDLANEQVAAPVPPRAQRACRVCGCTEFDCRQCVAATGEPCHWVEADLCSACVGKGASNG